MAQRIAWKGGNDAVSEIIGEFMMLVITVMLFVILIATVSSMLSRPPTQIVDMEVVASGTAIDITHKGGESIPYQDIGVVVNTVDQAVALADINANGLWDVGESLRVTGPGASTSFDVLIYDKLNKALLGNFRLG
jgi:hypothetical protein